MNFFFQEYLFYPAVTCKHYAIIANRNHIVFYFQLIDGDI